MKDREGWSYTKGKVVGDPLQTGVGAALVLHKFTCQINIPSPRKKVQGNGNCSVAWGNPAQLKVLEKSYSVEHSAMEMFHMQMWPRQHLKYGWCNRGTELFRL